jgi:sec-independent protein translocase protein TatA
MESVHFATFGMWELLVILLIVVLIFGAGKLPHLGEALGKSIRNFKKSMKEEPREISSEAQRLDEGSAPDELPSSKASTVEKDSRAGAPAERK